MLPTFPLPLADLGTMSASQRKLKDLRKLEEARAGVSSWDELKECLLEDGWCEPAREFDLDGQSLVGERIYVMVSSLVLALAVVHCS